MLRASTVDGSVPRGDLTLLSDITSRYGDGKLQKVMIVGLGYVGLTMASCLAMRGFQTIGVDVDSRKMAVIRAGKSPIHEPQLNGMIANGIESGALKVTEDFTSAAVNSQVIFVTVGTPSRPDGSMSMDQIESACESIGSAIRRIKRYQLVAIRSTVVPGTGEQLAKSISDFSGKCCGKDFGLCVNPEFLTEGSAVHNMLKPDRIIIGEYDRNSGDLLQDFYRQFHLHEMPPIIRTNLPCAELIKYANNAFLASKVSFINSIANLCENMVGGDVEVVASAIGVDPRIGSLFLKAGPGWGGSCFPKDLKAIASFAKDLGIELPMIDAALRINENQSKLIVEKARKALGTLRNQKIAILGLAFKPETDDVREAPSIKIIHKLLQEGAEISAYDPAAVENAKSILGKGVTFSKSAEECIDAADCCILVTEWEEFRRLRPEDFLKRMRKAILIDGRRLYNPIEFSQELDYHAVGLGAMRPKKPADLTSRS